MTKVQTTKLHTLTGHTDCVYALEHGAIPEQLFSGAGDGMVVKWDLAQPQSGTLVARLAHAVYALHYLPLRGLLVAGHNHEGIHLLNPSDLQEVRSLKLTTAAVFDIQSFNDTLFVSSGDGVVTIIDINDWVIRTRITASDKSARTIAINPAAGEFAVGYSDNFVRVFSLKDYRQLHAWEAHQNSVFTLAYTPDFKFLISGSRDARLKLWEAASGYGLQNVVVAHMYAINDIAFSPDGKHFVTCSLDKSIKVWDAANMTLLKVIDKARHAGHGTSVNKLLWTSYHQQVVSASDDRTMSVWSLDFLAFPGIE